MSNRETFTQALQCFADPQRRNDYFLLYANDILVHGYQGIGPGLERVKQFYGAFWKAFPDARIALHDLIVDHDTLVARYTILGTLQAPFMGIAAAGQKIELPGISILHFRDGQCFERWACSDSAVLLHQLSVSASQSGAPSA
jgi:predicted ester cyclase